MAFGRILVWSTACLGIALALTFVLAWMARPAVTPDDVDALRMVAVAPSAPHRLPVEFRLENTGTRPALVAADSDDEGVVFDLSLFDPDGAPVQLPVTCCLLNLGPPRFTTLKPGQQSEPLERGHPLSGWLSLGPVRPGRYRFVATYRYIPLDVRWQGLPLLSRWSEVDSEKPAALIRRTRAFTRTMDFEIDLP